MTITLAAPANSFPTVYLRDGEALIRTFPTDARCASCWKPVIRAWFAWDYTGQAERIAQWEKCRPGQRWTLGDEIFECYRHADGTGWCRETADSLAGRDYSTSFLLPRCGECGAWCSQTAEQRGYGDLTTCLNCRHEKWYDIGD